MYGQDKVRKLSKSITEERDRLEKGDCSILKDYGNLVQVLKLFYLNLLYISIHIYMNSCAYCNPKAIPTYFSS